MENTWLVTKTKEGFESRSPCNQYMPTIAQFERRAKTHCYGGMTPTISYLKRGDKILMTYIHQINMLNLVKETVKDIIGDKGQKCKLVHEQGEYINSENNYDKFDITVTIPFVGVFESNQADQFSGQNRTRDCVTIEEAINGIKIVLGKS